MKHIHTNQGNTGINTNGQFSFYNTGNEGHSFNEGNAGISLLHTSIFINKQLFMNQFLRRTVVTVITLLIINTLFIMTAMGQSCSTNNIGFNTNTATNTLSVCIGTTGTTVDGGNPTGTETFAWQVSSASASGPFSAVSPNPGDVQNWTISSTYYNTAGTYYFRRVISANASCNGNSDVITFTVNALPSNITISGGGTICGSSTTLTASNGGSGTIYYQGTTSGGTSTTTPSSSQVVSTSGTYYFRALSASGCWGAESSVAVTIIIPPVTTGASICQGNSATLSSSTNCPSFVNSGTSMSGTWTAATDPVANRLNGGIVNTASCAFESPAVTRNYVAQNFQVNVTGSYTFDMTQNNSYDGMGYIVSGAFVPGNCSGGGTFVRGDDDSGPDNEPSLTATLTAGVTYTLISTTWLATSGTYSGSFAWTVTPPSGGQIMLPVAAGIQWFTAASGGTAIGSGSPFNPVGVAGSGLANTNTPGTTVYYAECSANAGCRTATNFVIISNSTITLTSAVGTNNLSACKNAAITNVTYAIGAGGTGASITAGALPAGVTGAFSAGVFTISGTATVTGTFNYTITTSGGSCSQSTASGTITVNTPPTATFVKTMASACNGADGTITVTPAGGTSPYTYSWTSTPVGYTASTAAITNLLPKDYTVKVTDAKACSVTIPDITIWKALAPVVSYSAGGTGSCNNTGYMAIYGSYGVPPYTYSVDGTNYQAASTFTTLAAGTYTAYVKDARGCVGTKPGIVITAAPALVVTAYARPATSCANTGSIELYRTGGVPPYMYSLDNVTYYSSNIFSSLAGGTYTGWVRDAKGCKTSLANIVVTKPAAVTVTATKGNTSACANNGYIKLTAGGGVPGYTYSLTGAAGPYQASSLFTGLAAGTYNGWVMDSKGCKNVLFSIVIGTDAAATINVTANVTNSSVCTNNGSIQVFRTGGTGPYTYSLDNVTYQVSNMFSGLAGGTYTAWVKDARGCKGSKTNIVVKQATPLSSGESHTNASSCANDGTIQMRAAGGAVPYTYSLDDITYQSSNSFLHLAPNNYVVRVKDAAGCKVSVNITIAQGTPVVVTVYTRAATKCGTNDGLIQLFRTGGTGPYTYSLDGYNYQVSNSFLNILPGIYTGYVKDSRGCVGMLSAIHIGPECQANFAGTGNRQIKANTVETRVAVNSSFAVTAYPNPSATAFTLTLAGNSKEQVSLSVTDMTGRKVYQAETTGKPQFVFGADLKPGIYIVHVVQGDKRQSIRIIKE